MSRRMIIAVIGGNDLPDVALSARRFGELASNRAILLTGGKPSGGQVSEHVKTAAMDGAVNNRGLMVSVLPSTSPSCEREGHRLELRTGLSSYERDPITGSAADVVVVFPGGAGTLIELAFAALMDRPIIFLSSIHYLQVKCSLEITDLKKGLKEAVEKYGPLIPRLVNPAERKEKQLERALAKLEHALVRCLTNPEAACNNTPEGALQRIFGLSNDAIVKLNSDTSFLGLPQDDAQHWKKKFNEEVRALSNFSSGGPA